MGVPTALADGQLRLSPSLDTTDDDIDRTLVALHDAVRALRSAEA